MSITLNELKMRYDAALLRSFESSAYDGKTPLYEIRYNHNHDGKGRFCSGGSSVRNITPKPLDKGGKSGIMNVKQTKLTDNYSVSNPMNSKRYHKIKERLEQNGCPVIAAHGEDERFLIAFGAEAISDEHGIMHLGDVPSASAFFEEIIHNTQMKKYGVADYDATGIERAAREVAANRKLLKHGKAYGFTDEDFEEISRNLKIWEDTFERKVGVTYDKSDIKRDI